VVWTRPVHGLNVFPRPIEVAGGAMFPASKHDPGIASLRPD